MFELLEEDDFSELPEEEAHKWLQLEKVARSRLLRALTGEDEATDAKIQLQYMNVISTLAEVIPPEIKGLHK